MKTITLQETADPETDDEKYFFTLEEAKEHLETVNMNVGFQGIVDKFEFEYVNFNEEFDFGSYGDIEDFIPSNTYPETEYLGDLYEGEDVIGSIIVQWSYEKHVGYCRNLQDIGIAGEYPFHELKTEKDLITGNEESTFRSNYSVLLTKDELCIAENKREAVEAELQRGHWKWSYFRNNPNSYHIVERLDELFGKGFDYPFSEGDDYWTIENGEVVWSCWDEQSEEIFRENPEQKYFETEEEAKNSL